MAAIHGRQRIGDKQLGVLFDGGKVRRRREWRGVKDTLYDYGRWLYILSILAKFIVKPRNIKAMCRCNPFQDASVFAHITAAARKNNLVRAHRQTAYYIFYRGSVKKFNNGHSEYFVLRELLIRV